ncbi:MarR family transcriptional regulator [Pseudomonas oryzihabitans]|uniref:MarR family winged helix-turn-helix transcriptional regulator n=1 Tax=Pseudomonas rhizoryzae TaxID=2571129 RepID=UPI000736C5F0|nr:MarR family transcriptional regulator [Pseudomonas rhizoryzae]KTS79214.1 MarR family transcriptional regulator [Pseudomonas psychrotolerans]KTS99407.1 MarR family transcriptional regulator [Pseudomonas psychrotolerans]KTT11278.1 MarR family transcriptional regulator [Pseudomonas psychrotolerans]KTT24616.1 MarR family transcriptional regulator [Pseudomonas psychrotolerans]KTT29294.1 MarR family transcriptional regulator [Pseudomonas psychrotolerans]
MLDLNQTANQREVMETFFFGYQAFTAKADDMLARRGLSRVHQRILFFIAREPGLSNKALLEVLNVTKQALNIPLRQLLEMQLVTMETDAADKRKRRLSLTRGGAALEQTLRREQMRLVQSALAVAGPQAAEGWLAFNQALSGRRDSEVASQDS